MLKQKELEHQLAAAKLEAQNMQARAEEHTLAHAQAKDEASTHKEWLDHTAAELAQERNEHRSAKEEHARQLADAEAEHERALAEHAAEVEAIFDKAETEAAIVVAEHEVAIAEKVSESDSDPTRVRSLVVARRHMVY